LLRLDSWVREKEGGREEVEVVVELE